MKNTLTSPHASPIRQILGLILAVLFSWLIARHIQWDEFVVVLKSTQWQWILLALTSFIMDYTCRVVRWHIMLRHDNPRLTPLKCAGPFFASFAANNLLPFRAGDIMRAFTFNCQLGTTSGNVLATLFVERLLDLLMVIIILDVALITFGLDATNIVGLGAWILLVGGLAIFILLLFPASLTPLIRLAVALVNKLSSRAAIKLAKEVDQGLLTLNRLARGSTMVKLLLLSLFAWLAEGLLFWCAAMALPAITVPMASWIALPAGTLATLIPSTPGYVGTFDYFTVRAMVLPGNLVVAATAYAILVHMLLWIPPTVIGGLYLATYQIKMPQSESGS